MTVPTTSNRADAVGNGVTTAFPAPFRFLLATDLVVTVNGVVQTINTQYTVSGTGDQGGGTVTFLVAPVNASKVVIRNIPPANQLVDFVNNITVLESVLDGALDKLTILIQQQAASLVDAMTKNSLISTPVWLGQGLEITNIVPGLASNSAATVSQILALVIASGNVPTPLGGDVGKFLQATGAGVYSWQTPPASPGIATTGVAGLVTLATDAEIRASAGSVASDVVTATSLASAAVQVGLTDAATIALDWNAGINFSVGITANRTLGNPTNGKPGTWRTVYVAGNDATLRTLAFGANFLGEVPALNDITLGKNYLISIYCQGTSHFVASAKRAIG